MNESVRTELLDLLAVLQGDVPLPDQEIHDICRRVADAMEDNDQYRLEMVSVSTLLLAYEFAVLANMVDLVNGRDSAATPYLGKHLGNLRDVCAAEGIRRGVILSPGDDLEAQTLAVTLMEKMMSALELSGWQAD